MKLTFVTEFEHCYEPEKVPLPLLRLDAKLIYALFDCANKYGLRTCRLGMNQRVIYLGKNPSFLVKVDNDSMWLFVGSISNGSYHINCPKNGLAIAWQSNLHVSEVTQGLDRLNRIMEARGLYNPTSKTRLEILSTKEKYRVRDFFPDCTVCYFMAPTWDIQAILQRFDYPENLGIGHSPDKIPFICLKNYVNLLESKTRSDGVIIKQADELSLSKMVQMMSLAFRQPEPNGSIS